MQKIKIGAVIFLSVLFIISCQKNGNQDIVGRWEKRNESDPGMPAYEFYADGTFAVFRSMNLFDPITEITAYTFDETSGILTLKYPDIPDEVKKPTLYIQIVSKDTISVGPNEKILTNYQRATLPELPPGARKRIAGLMLNKTYQLVDAEKINSKWSSDYEVVSQGNFDAPSKSYSEDWLVVLEVAGKVQTYVLQKEDKLNWNWVHVIRVPDVPKDILASLDNSSPGAKVLSAQKSTSEINGSLAWCIVYREKDGGLARMLILITEPINITDVPESTFDSIGCTNLNIEEF